MIIWDFLRRRHQPPKPTPVEVRRALYPIPSDPWPFTGHRSMAQVMRDEDDDGEAA